MEEGDEEALKVWKRFRELSVSEYKKIYAKLNVEFDVYSGESLQSERMKVELEKLNEMNLVEDSQGARVCSSILLSHLITAHSLTTIDSDRQLGSIQFGQSLDR